MALNYSSCSFLVNEDCAAMMRGCGCWSEEASPLSSCGVNSLWWDELEFELELEEEDDFDPVDLLPTDPFGMNLETTFTAAIASCIEDLTVMSSAGRFGDSGSDAVFADLSYYLNQAFALPPEFQFGGYGGVFEGPLWFGGLPVDEGNSFGFMEDTSSREGPLGIGGLSVDGGNSFGFVEDASSSEGPLEIGGLSVDEGNSFGFMEDTSSGEGPLRIGGLSVVGGNSFGFVEDTSSSGNGALVSCDAVEDVPTLEGGIPHEGMMYALAYLGLRDILSVEMVCKTLRSAVRNEPLLWKSIHIKLGLTEKISDAGLLYLTRKCPDTLQSLNIEHCLNITDQGLKAVLENNPTLTKLSIKDCARLTIDGLISNLKSFNTKAVVGIKHLRVGTLFSLQKEQYEELLSLLNTDRMQEVHNREPRFLRGNQILSDCNDGYALDIEMCPICQNYKLVYDCPEEGCEDRKSGKCKGCTICIRRCYTCGKCVDHLAYKESFSLDWICPTCQENGAASLPRK